MSTDLEADLRDALRARADAVTSDSLRHAAGPRDGRPRSRAWPILAAAAVVAALAVSLAVWPKDHARDDRGRPAAGPLAVPAAGTSWRLEKLWSPDGTVARPPAKIRATLEFLAGGRIVGDDTFTSLRAVYSPTAHGFEVRDMSRLGIAYGSKDRVRVAVRYAIGAIFADAGGDPVDVESHVDGDRLTLLVSGYTLQFRRVVR